MNDKPFFSICIPTYEMHGHGVIFLKFNLYALQKQTFKDFEVIVSDHSKNDDIKNLCESIKDLNIKYIKNNNNIGNSSANVNNAILNSSGKWIKIIFQDDFLYGKHALDDLNQFIIEHDFQNGWIVTACDHTIDGNTLISPYIPRWSLDAIKQGHNTISSPSVLCFKNEYTDNLLFDEKLVWLMDICYYYKLYLKFGEPKILDKPNSVNRVWEGSVTSSVEQITKDKELDYFQNNVILV